MDDKLNNPRRRGVEVDFVDLGDKPFTAAANVSRNAAAGSESKRGAPHIGTPLSISCWT
jgi:hypothetical protein